MILLYPHLFGFEIFIPPLQIYCKKLFSAYFGGGDFLFLGFGDGLVTVIFYIINMKLIDIKGD
jgi:hypothetical protein